MNIIVLEISQVISTWTLPFQKTIRALLSDVLTRKACFKTESLIVVNSRGLNDQITCFEQNLPCLH